MSQTLILILTILVKTFGTEYSRMNQVRFVEDRLYKIWRGMVCIKHTIPLQIFKRLSSTNFVWSIVLEYFFPFDLMMKRTVRLIINKMDNSSNIFSSSKFSTCFYNLLLLYQKVKNSRQLNTTTFQRYRR